MKTMLTRREALKTVALAGAAALTLTDTFVQAAAESAAEPLFKLPPLPYPFDALEPHIDARTMEIHHDKHHATYVKNLDRAIAEAPEFYSSLKARGATNDSLPKLLADLNSVPEKIRTAVRNNGGGHLNHSLFWQMMRKNGGGEPKGPVGEAIARQFGSYGAFKDQFTKAALGQFGSGWAWLTLDGDALKVEAQPNQDTPISLGRPVLLGIDVWEHAYYLKYQNNRASYIDSWFNVINWDFVAERYASLKA